MTLWACELKGGPFSGDTAKIEKLPPVINVKPCDQVPSCGTHWYEGTYGGGEPYTLDEVFDDHRATYAHGDLTGGDTDIVLARDEEPVPA